MADNRDRLAARAELLAEQVTALTDAVSELDTRTTRSGRVLAVAVAGLVLDLLLSVGVVVALTGQAAAAEQQNRIRDEALCPLYQLFVGSYNPESRQAGSDRERYEDAFVTIRAAYAALRCTGDPVPPPRR